MSFIGNVPAEAYSPVVKDTFSGNGSTTDFTLSIPATTNSVNVYVENVAQEPTNAYTISGTTLSFTAAPVSGTDNIYVVHRGPAAQTVVPPAGVVLSPSTVTASGDISTEGDLKVEVASGGIYTITGTDTASNRTLTLPDEAGTVLTSASDIVASQLPTGSVLQVVQDIKTDTFSTSSTSFTNVTGLSVSITPSSANSEILILAYVSYNNDNSAFSSTHIRLTGGNSDDFVGDAASSRTRSAGGTTLGTTTSEITQFSDTIVYVDSPATTSPVTYDVQIRNDAGATSYINRTTIDGDISFYMRTASSIIAMEIAG